MLKASSSRNWPIVTGERQIDPRTKNLQRLDAALRLFQLSEMRLGSGQYCTAGPLDVWLPQGPLRRLNRLLKSSQEETGFRPSYQELSKIRILRAETHCQLDVR